MLNARELDGQVGNQRQDPCKHPPDPRPFELYEKYGIWGLSKVHVTPEELKNECSVINAIAHSVTSRLEVIPHEIKV